MIPSDSMMPHAQRQLLDYLSVAYKDGTGLDPGQEHSNQLVVDAFIEFLPHDVIPKIKAFLAERPHIFERVKEKSNRLYFFSQASVLLTYYMAYTMPAQLREHWPIEWQILAWVFSDLGVRFE